MKPGNIDVTRLRPAKSAKQADNEATCIILVGLLLLGCCCGGSAVAALWAVIG